jgi:hypothetical protein
MAKSYTGRLSDKRVSNLGRKKIAGAMVKGITGKSGTFGLDDRGS